jgi:hypothetical protein
MVGPNARSLVFKAGAATGSLSHRRLSSLPVSLSPYVRFRKGKGQSKTRKAQALARWRRGQCSSRAQLHVRGHRRTTAAGMCAALASVIIRHDGMAGRCYRIAGRERRPFARCASWLVAVGCAHGRPLRLLNANCKCFEKESSARIASRIF